MKFRTIEIHNFGRFKGTHLLQVDTTDNRNVILVKGDNDRGKTTLFDAIFFAMYGPNLRRENAPHPEEYVNLHAAREGPGEMRVEIKFEHEGDEYKIERVQKFYQAQPGDRVTLDDNDKVTIWEGSSPNKLVSREKQQDWINHILPYDASQFFFFDGEEIKRYVSKESTDKVKKSIEKVLGIKELLNAREDLTKIYNELWQAHKRLIRLKSADQKAVDEVEALDDEIEDIDKEIDHLSSEISSADEIVRKYDQELKRYASIQQKVFDRIEADRQLEETNLKIKAASNELRNIRGNAGLLLLEPLLDTIWNKEEISLPENLWESDLAQRLINSHATNCICGTPLDDEKLNSLKSKITQLKPSKYSKVRKMANVMLVSHQPIHIKDKFIAAIQEKSDLEQKQAEWKDTIDKLTVDIGHNAELGPIIQDYNSRRANAYNDMKSYQVQKENLETKKKDSIRERDAKKRKLTRGIKDSELEKAYSNLEFAGKVKEAIEVSIERITQQRIGDIEKYSSDIFGQLTNNPKLYSGLEIDDAYQIKVKRYDGTILPTYRYSPSAGASQIIATSIIAGLSRYTTRQAPIVIDTPLGRLDPTHRKSLIRLYSSLSSQVIIIYQPSELDQEDLKLFGDAIASEWLIEEDRSNPALSIIIRE